MPGEHIPIKAGNEHAVEDAELEEALGDIWEIATENHLEPFPTHFEVVPANIIHQISAYALPGRYAHWTHGRTYRQMQTTYNFGLSKIYELVINSNPAQAFLLENNPPIENKFVMAHVLAHSDFFKNNHMFANTRRNMPEISAKNAERIKSYEDAEGRLVVEEFLDAALAINQHVDPHYTNRPTGDDELRQWREQEARSNKLRQKINPEFDDLFGPPAATVEQNLGRRARLLVPPSPDADVMGFIRNHAPYLEDWQRDIVDIVRNDSLYFYPQFRTKIMNEGWAAFWHKRIMREMGDRGLISDTENEAWWQLHSGVVAPSQTSLNPYYLGMKMYEYIADYHNGELTDKETAYLQEQGLQTYPRYVGPLKDSPAIPYLRDAMVHNDDQSLIRNYFNKITADRLGMYIYETRRTSPLNEPTKVVLENGWQKIRDYLVFTLENSGVPNIVVTDGNHNGSGELYLMHEFDGRSLDAAYVEKTLPYLYKLWQRPVHLETVEAKTGKQLIYTYSGEKVTSILKATTPKPKTE